MMAQYTTYLKQLYQQSPQSSIQKILKKLRREDGDGIFQTSVFEESPKVVQPQRMTNFLMRYEAMARRLFPLWSLDVRGKTILEVGGGPMFGWGLLALFRGAERYVFVEPMFNPILVTHPTAEYYFWLTHKDLTALYGPQMTYLDFRRAIDEKIEVHRVPMESFEEDISVDVFLSNSTLEHVQDLDEMIARFARCASPRAHFLHVVDFGNHQEKLRPFHGMYSMEPGTYHEKHGNEINLLRYPDMLRAFARQGMPADFVPYYHMDTFSEPIHPWWKDRYSQEELLLKVGLFINQRP